jgi:hypothetical protein
MSDINGSGYGDKHDWERLDTAQVGSWGRKSTMYRCRKCLIIFYHYYDEIPDIFKAMENQDIPENCQEAK